MRRVSSCPRVVITRREASRLGIATRKNAKRADIESSLFSAASIVVVDLAESIVLNMARSTRKNIALNSAPVAFKRERERERERETLC